MGALNKNNGTSNSQLDTMTNDGQWVKIKIVDDIEYQELLANPPIDNVIYLGKEV